MIEDSNPVPSEKPIVGASDVSDIPRACMYIHRIDPHYSAEEHDIWQAGFRWSMTTEPTRPDSQAQILNCLRDEAEVDGCILNAVKFGIPLKVITR